MHMAKRVDETSGVSAVEDFREQRLSDTAPDNQARDDSSPQSHLCRFVAHELSASRFAPSLVLGIERAKSAARHHRIKLGVDAGRCTSRACHCGGVGRQRHAVIGGSLGQRICRRRRIRIVASMYAGTARDCRRLRLGEPMGRDDIARSGQARAESAASFASDDANRNRAAGFKIGGRRVRHGRDALRASVAVVESQARAQFEICSTGKLVPSVPKSVRVFKAKAGDLIFIPWVRSEILRC
jgi:hypothetical protein